MLQGRNFLSVTELEQIELPDRNGTPLRALSTEFYFQFNALQVSEEHGTMWACQPPDTA
jgi:hypothetical protein